MSAVAMNSLNAWFYRQMAIWSALLRRDDLAIEYWERVRSLRPRDTNVLSAIANRRAARGDRREAIAVLEHSIEIDPTKAHAWFNLGFLQQELGEHDAAIRSFDAALERDAKLDRAWYGKALSLIRLGRLEEALVALKKNIALQPFSPFGYYQLAHACQRLGRTDEVIATIRKLSQFEPKVAVQLERETGVDAGIEDPYAPGTRTKRGAVGRNS